MNKKKNSAVLFWGFIVVLAVAKQFLVYDLPIYAWPGALPDDGLMVYLAEFLKSGQWLGNYNQMTLVKGIGYPLFLVIANFLPFSYLSVSSLFYTVSVLVMVYAVKPLFRSYKSMGILYAVLLFLPVSASLVTFLRIYRNSISAAQVLLIIGSFAGMYFRRELPLIKQLPWLFGSIIGLVGFYYTREDAIWILPFVLVVTVIYVGTVISRYFRCDKKAMAVRVVMVLLPLICVSGTGKLISFLNQHYYETSVVNELNDGSFAEMMKTIYSVDDEMELKQTSVSRAKLKQLYQYSQTLASIQNEMDVQLAHWCGDAEYSKVWEVQDGWFFWILRDAMAAAGYYQSAEAMNDFCEKVTAELKENIVVGNLGERKTMPSAMMSPWREEYLSETFLAMWDLHVYANSYEGLETRAAYSVDDNVGGIGDFEEITGNHVFCYENGKVEAGGWLASSEIEVLKVRDISGNIIETVEWIESPDIEMYLSSIGKSEKNSGCCRFQIQVTKDQYEKMLNLCGYDEKGEEVFCYELASGAEGFDNEKGILKLDYCYVLPNTNEHVEKVSWKIDVLNRIHSCYVLTGPYLWLVGVLMFLYVTIRMLMGIKKKQKHLNIWLVLSALLCSYLVLLGGIGYTHVSAFDAINTTYLSAAYPLIATFWCIGILKFVEDMVEYRPKKLMMR